MLDQPVLEERHDLGRQRGVVAGGELLAHLGDLLGQRVVCLLYTSDAADERSSVDLGGRRIIKKKK